MALTCICPKCTRPSGFELCEISLKNREDKQLYIVRCGLCGAAIGALDSIEGNTAIEIFIEKINALEEKLNNIENTLALLSSIRS